MKFIFNLRVLCLVLVVAVFSGCLAQDESGGIDQRPHFENSEEFLALKQILSDRNTASLKNVEKQNRTRTSEPSSFSNEDKRKFIEETKEFKDHIQSNPGLINKTSIESLESSFFSPRSLEYRKHLRKRFSPSYNNRDLLKNAIIRFRVAYPNVPEDQMLESLEKKY